MIYYFMCHGSLYHNMNVCHDITNDKTKQNFEHKQKISRVYAVPAKLLNPLSIVISVYIVAALLVMGN